MNNVCFIGGLSLFTMLTLSAANANESGLPVTIKVGVVVQTLSTSVEPVQVDEDGVVNF